MAAKAGTGGQVVAVARPLGFWLKLVDRLIDEQFAEVLGKFSVSRRQWEILNMLAPGPSTLGNLNLALAPFLDLKSRESAASHIASLIDRGWVDVAFEYYELTREGASKQAELLRLIEEKHTTTLDGVMHEDFTTSLRVLERIAKNLDWNP